MNILTCISQENHKFCYTSAFPRFCQDLIVVILVYSLSILIFFLWTGVTLAVLSTEGKIPVEKGISHVSHLQQDIILQ